MEARHARLLEFISNAFQFVVPIYQRTYSWKRQECRQLWDDIMRTGGNNGVQSHFLGSVVYIAKKHSNIIRPEPYLIIDGQQRLTSILLLLAALVPKVGEEAAKTIRNNYLKNPFEHGERTFKMLLSGTDRATLNAILTDGTMPEELSVRVNESFGLFKNWLSEEDSALQIWAGLSKLMIVDVALERDKDNPQLIFESMNSTGKALSQADLIRNFVLMGLEPNRQNEIYEGYWRLMEIGFGQTNLDSHFDEFMRHYLTAMTGAFPNKKMVYTTYKDYFQKQKKLGRETENLAEEIYKYSLYYRSLALGEEKDPRLEDAFKDLRELKVNVVYPLLLEVYADYKKNILTADDILEIVYIVEAYIFRRAVCDLPSNQHRKTFPALMRDLDKGHYLKSLKSRFFGMKSRGRFPRDHEFIDRIQSRDLYNFNFRNYNYWLRKFENFGRKEHVSVSEYTIEHILPQNENLPRQWRDDLGDDWERVRDQYLHTLGNLTLTGYNSEYSDRSFTVKRDMKGGFRDSPLRVNAGLGQVEKWDEDAIKNRAERLAKQAAQIWPEPWQPWEKFADVQPPAKEADNYSIDDYPNLVFGENRELFNRFQRMVTSLDHRVIEQFRKEYISYRLDKVFASVIPQTKALMIVINIDHGELYDPRNAAADVSNKGHLGVGNTRVHLSNFDEVTYVVGLVRQALDRQVN